MNVKLVIAITLIAVLLGAGCTGVNPYSVTTLNQTPPVQHIQVVWSESIHTDYGYDLITKVSIPEDGRTCYITNGATQGISCLQDNR